MTHFSNKIKDTVEYVEEYKGAFIKSRTEYLFNTSPSTTSIFGLQPDACILYKQQLQSSLFGTYEPQTTSFENSTAIGYFHFIFGLDCSNALSISTYITNILKKQTQPGWFEAKYKIIRATICIYNCLSKYDLRVEVDFPGVVNAYTINEKGERNDKITEEMWRETYLCSFLRCVQYQSYPYDITGVKFLPLYETITTAKEKLLLLQAKKSFSKALNTGTNTRGFDLLSIALRDYLVGYCRYNQAYSFFDDLKEVNSHAIIHIAYIQQKLHNYGEAEMILTNALVESAENVPLIIAECELLLARYEYNLKKADKEESGAIITGSAPTSKQPSLTLVQEASLIDSYATNLCKAAIQLAPRSPHPWLTLAKLLVHSKYPEQAFYCLNGIPVPNTRIFDAKQREANILGIPQRLIPDKTEPEGMVVPKFVSIERSRERLVFESPEDETQNEITQQALKLLPGNRFNYSTQDDGERQYLELMYEAYHVLVKVYQSIGWDEVSKKKKVMFRQPGERPAPPAQTNVATASSSTTAPPVEEQKVEQPESPQQPIISEIPPAEVKAQVVQAEEKQEPAAEAQPTEVKSPEPSASETKEEIVQQTSEAPVNTASEQVEATHNTEAVSETKAAEAESQQAAPQEQQSNVEPQIAAAEAQQTQSEPESQPATTSTTQTAEEPTRTDEYSSKPECMQWLDELFTILYEDLNAFAQWKISEEKKDEQEQKLTSSDWFYRGLLAERLKLPHAAMRAYRVSSRMGMNVKSLLRLLQLLVSNDDTEFSLLQDELLVSDETPADEIIEQKANELQREPKDARLRESMVIIDKLIRFYGEIAEEYKSTDEERKSHIHPFVIQALHTLISKFGLQAIRRQAKILNISQKKTFMELLFDSVKWNSFGFDK